MRRQNLSFSEYLNLYKEKTRSAEVKRVFLRVDDFGIEHEDERAIWATWKMNIEGLSEIVRIVITVFAFFDASPVPKELVMQLDISLHNDPLSSVEVVQVELGVNVSLIQEHKIEKGVYFEMH